MVPGQRRTTAHRHQIISLSGRGRFGAEVIVFCRRAYLFLDRRHSPQMEPCWRSCTERHPTRCRYFKSRMECALELCLFREAGAPPLLWVGRQTVWLSDRVKSRMSYFMHGQVSGNCTSWRWSMRAMSSSRPVTASWRSAPGRLVGCCRLTHLPRPAFRRKLIGEVEVSPQRAHTHPSCIIKSLPHEHARAAYAHGRNCRVGSRRGAVG